MRQNSQSALLRQVRVWQKAVLLQINLESSQLDASRVTRHLILILLVLRILEQQNQQQNQGACSFRIRSLAQLQEAYPTGKPGDDRLYQRLVELWRSTQPDFAGLPVALELVPDLPLPDRLLRSMIRGLYPSEPESSGEVLFCASLLGQVYETLLIDSRSALNQDSAVSDSTVRSARRKSQRKSQGIYYTPAPIVQFIVQQTIDRLLEGVQAPDRSLTVDALPRLLDPACGGGAFLLGVYQALLDWQLGQLVGRFAVSQRGDRDPTGHEWLVRGAAGEWQLSWAARQQILQHCIYGVDLDPEAVTITQLSLWLKLLEGTIALSDTPPKCLPDLSANLHIGNVLLDEETIPTAADRPPHVLDSHGIHWKKTFPAIMRSGGFDGVIGNPPYLDSEQMKLSCPTWRTYCTSHYQTAIGNWDLFCVFVEKALMLCRVGGVSSLIVPNKLASAPYAAQARSLLMQHRLLFVRDYAQVPVFGAAVYPIVYGVQKSSPTSPSPLLSNPVQVRYEVMENLTQVQRSGWLSRNSPRADACWGFAESALYTQVMQRLQQLPTLGSIAQIYGAATVAEAYALKPLLHDCETPTGEDVRFVNSGTIDRYRLRWGKKPTRYLGQIYQYPILQGDRLHHLSLRRQQQVRQPKIIVAGLSQQLECVLDAAGNLLAGKSTCIILGIHEALDWRYLLALLNSSLLTAYLRDGAGGNQLQNGYLRVGTAQLKPLPIYLPDFTQRIDRAIYAEIIDLAQRSISRRLLNESDDMMQRHSEIDSQIDQRIAHLYRLTDEETAAIPQTQFQQG